MMKFGGPLEKGRIANRVMRHSLLSLKRKILMKNLKKIENSRLMKMDIIETYHWHQSLTMSNLKRIISNNPHKFLLDPQIKILKTNCKLVLGSQVDNQSNLIQFVKSMLTNQIFGSLNGIKKRNWIKSRHHN